MVANLKALAASVQALSERLTPALDELGAASQEAADHAARLSERGARAVGRSAAVSAPPGSRTGTSLDQR